MSEVSSLSSVITIGHPQGHAALSTNAVLESGPDAPVWRRLQKHQWDEPPFIQGRHCQGAARPSNVVARHGAGRTPELLRRDTPQIAKPERSRWPALRWKDTAIPVSLKGVKSLVVKGKGSR